MSNSIAINVCALLLLVGDVSAISAGNVTSKESGQHAKVEGVREDVYAFTLLSSQNDEICGQVTSVLNGGSYRYDGQSLSLMSTDSSLVKWKPLGVDGVIDSSGDVVKGFRDGEVSVPAENVDLDGDDVADHVYRMSYSMSDVKRHGVLVLNHDAVKEWGAIMDEVSRECHSGNGSSCKLMKGMKEKFSRDGMFKILFSMKKSLKNEIWASSITNLFENKSNFSSLSGTADDGYSFGSFVELIKVNGLYYFGFYPIGSVGKEKLVIALPSKSKAVDGICAISINIR